MDLKLQRAFEQRIGRITDTPGAIMHILLSGKIHALLLFSCGQFYPFTSGLLQEQVVINSLRPRDAYMCRKTNHHWFR